MISLVATAVVVLVPVEYVFDCSGWTGKAISEVEIDLTTADGKTFSFACELSTGTTTEDMRDSIGGVLSRVGWNHQKVGKDVLVIRGSKTSPIRSATVKGQTYVPVVTRRVAVPSPREKEKK